MLVKMRDSEIGVDITVGKVLDKLENFDNPALKEVLSRVKEEPELQELLEEEVKIEGTVGDVLKVVGEEEVTGFIEEKAAQASYVADYDHTEENIFGYWRRLSLFVFVFAMLAMITLEFIDKDKR